MEFGDILKKLREESELTQEELALRLGINRSSIAGYESKNVKKPEFDTFIKIADYFKVSADFLLGRSDIRIFEGELEKLIKKEPRIDAFIQKLLSDYEYRELATLSVGLDDEDIRKICDIMRIVF